MKNLLKIASIAMALLMTVVLVTKSNAATDSLVTITMTDTASSCTLSDYTFAPTASVNDQDVHSSNTLSCNLLRNLAQAITLGSNDLVSPIATIAANKLFATGSALTESGTLSAGSALPASSVLTPAPTVYSKATNQVGIMTQSIDLWVRIDAGKPAATYTGYLDIDIPNN